MSGNNLPLTNIKTPIKAAAYAGLFLLLYRPAFAYMVELWEQPQYNYCYFIPFIVLYLIWDKRESLGALPAYTSWKGLLLVAPGIMLFWVGELGGEYFTLHISFWLVLVGICWIHLGWPRLKSIAFALVMILTMFPLPNFLYSKISVQLQLISSKLGTTLMRLYGLSVHREGNVIDLAFTKLQVVEACSGLRSLTSLVVLGLLMAYFLRDRLWKRGLLVLSVIPLSIFANSIRLALTGVLHQTYGSRVAEGFFHGFSGWVIFCFAFLVLLAETWVLKRIGQPSGPVTDESAISHGNPLNFLENDEPGQRPSSHPGRLLSPPFIVVSLLLTLTIAVSQTVNFREKIPIKKPLGTFPLEIGKWEGDYQTMRRGLIRSLDLSDYVMVSYKAPSEETVHFYVAYYESQRKH